MNPQAIRSRRTRILFLCSAVVLMMCATPAVSAAEFQPLFNGKDLSGWKPTGKPSAWSVRDGMIECNGSGGGWLLTEKKYGDFVLQLRYKVSPGCNSGIAIRSAPRKPGFTGMELQILDDWGKRPNKHSAMAVYSSIKPAKNMSKPAGQWNTVEVTCVDRHLVVVWNGERVHDVDLDSHRELADRNARGHIGVQDHGHFVWFRDIRIKDLDHAEGWEPLLTEGLDGWKQIGDGQWKHDGYGTVTATGKLGVLLSPKSYQDFVLKLQAQVSKGGNGGIFLRLPPAQTLDPKPWVSGYEVQFQDDAGKPPTNVSTGSVVLIAAPKSNRAKPAGAWNDFEITCRGETIAVKLNGEPVTEAKSDRRAEGHLGLESEVGRIQYRHIKAKPLGK